MVQYILLWWFSFLIWFVFYFFSEERIINTFKNFPKFNNIKKSSKYFLISFIITSIILDLLLYYILWLYVWSFTIFYKIILLWFILINKFLALLFTYDLFFSELYLIDLFLLYVLWFIFLQWLFFIYPNLLWNFGVWLFYFFIAWFWLIIFLALNAMITSLFKFWLKQTIKEIKKEWIWNYILQFTWWWDFIIIPFFAIYWLIVSTAYSINIPNIIKFYLLFIIVSWITTILYSFIHKYTILKNENWAIPLFPWMIIWVYISLLIITFNLKYIHLN